MPLVHQGKSSRAAGQPHSAARNAISSAHARNAKLQHDASRIGLARPAINECSVTGGMCGPPGRTDVRAWITDSRGNLSTDAHQFKCGLRPPGPLLPNCSAAMAGRSVPPPGPSVLIAFLSGPRGRWSGWGPPGVRGSSLTREAEPLVPSGAIPQWAMPPAPASYHGDIRVAGVAARESWMFMSAASDHGRFLVRCLQRCNYRRIIRL